MSLGCPKFPANQWLNVIKGQAVDLAKVLGACYSTEIEPKQSHDLGDLFQLTVKLPKVSRAIWSHRSWVIAFNKTIEATTFIFP